MKLSQSEVPQDWDLPREVDVEVREHFGVRRAYPVTTTAVVFSHISGQKTLTKSVIRDIAKLGYEFFVIQPVPGMDKPLRMSVNAEQLVNSITE